VTTNGGDSTCRFREEQWFSQWWLYLLMGVVAAGTTTLFSFAMFRQLVQGHPWGDRPMSDTALAIMGPLVILAGWGAFVFLRCVKLLVEVRESGVMIRFRPFVRRNILYGEIRTCEARTYRPIAEYGGWGVRLRRGGMAYNVSGDRGVQLELVNGKRVLIGSQRAGELADAIQERMKRAGPR
jgi:hypothetical protein